MRYYLALVALLAVLACAPAASQSASPQTPQGRLLSRTELRACIQQEEELGRRHDALRSAHETQQVLSSKLSDEAIELSRILRSIDPSDAAAIDLYNQRNEVRNSEVDAYNKRADALNAAVADLRDAEAEYIATCASRPFLRVDESAVLKELNLKERRYDRDRRQVPTRAAGKSRV